MKIFNEAELKQYDGSNPANPVYVAFKGKVYDVTTSPLFIDGMHFEHYAGASNPANPVYIAFKGKVYDVTTSPLFIDGMHFEHYAGADLTDFIEDAPHGEEVMGEMTVVGEYKK